MERHHGENGSMNIVITGATGTIGRALVNRFVDNGDKVTVIIRPHSSRISNINKDIHVNIVECDISRLQTLSTVLREDYDVFYHMAWEGTTGKDRDNIALQKKNIDYTQDAVELAHYLGCRRFIGIGSQAEYGRIDKCINEDTITRPETAYGAAKLSAGHMSRLRCEQLGLEHIWVRVFSVFGPGEGDNSLIQSAILHMIRGEAFKCTAGEQIWNYIYNRDAAEALFLLADRGISGKVYCLGEDKAISLKEYIELIRRCAAQGLDMKGLPEVRYGMVAYSDKQVMHLETDISLLKKDTGYRPKYSFEQGISETIDWRMEEYENQAR